MCVKLQVVKRFVISNDYMCKWEYGHTTARASLSTDSTVTLWVMELCWRVYQEKHGHVNLLVWEQLLAQG